MQAMPTETEKVDGIAKIPAACASTTSKYLRKKVIQVCCIEVIRIQLFRVNRIKLVRVIRIKFFRPMVSNPIVHPVHVRCCLVPFAPHIAPVAGAPLSFGDGVLKVEKVSERWAEKESTAEPECVPSVAC